LNSILSYLRQTGVSDEECKVYDLLNSRGEKQAGQISQTLSIPRVRTYRILSSLESKGLVRASISRPMKFIATSPETFVENSVSLASSRLDLLGRLGTILGAFVQDATLSDNEKRDLPFDFQIIHSRQTIIQRVRSIIKSDSKGRIFLVLAETDESHELSTPIWESISKGEKDSERKMVKVLLSGGSWLFRQLRESSIFVDKSYYDRLDVRSYAKLNLDCHLVLGEGEHAMIIRKDISSALWIRDATLIQVVSHCIQALWLQSAMQSESLSNS
jgi:sugar-specific transcriptional regulator TrmB